MRIARFVFLFATLILASGLSPACADDPRSAVERAGDFDAQYLHGPAGNAYNFRGFIADRPSS